MEIRQYPGTLVCWVILSPPFQYYRPLVDDFCSRASIPEFSGALEQSPSEEKKKWTPRLAA